jgi:hypothetical protein
MKKSIRFAVFGILLAFAAPAPVAESLTGSDQEAVLEISRSARTGRRIAPSRPAVPTSAAASPAPKTFAVDSALPVRCGEDVVPRILSRPPPG